MALVEHGLPGLVGLTNDAFAEAAEALRRALRACVSGGQARGRAPFVLVVSGGLDTDMGAVEQQVPLLRLAGRM